jgi:hypothetical protein
VRLQARGSVTVDNPAHAQSLKAPGAADSELEAAAGPAALVSPGSAPSARGRECRYARAGAPAPELRPAGRGRPALRARGGPAAAWASGVTAAGPIGRLRPDAAH